MSAQPKSTNTLQNEGGNSIVFTNLSKYVKVADIEGHLKTLNFSSFDINEIKIDPKTKKGCCTVNFPAGSYIRKILNSKHRNLGINVSVIIQDQSLLSNSFHGRLPSISIIPANISSQKNNDVGRELSPMEFFKNGNLVLVECTQRSNEKEIEEIMTVFGKVLKVVPIDYLNNVYKYCIAFKGRKSAKRAIKQQIIGLEKRRLFIQKFTSTEEKGSLTWVSTRIGGSSNTRKASNIRGEISPVFNFPLQEHLNKKNRSRQYSEVLQLHSPNTCLAAGRNFKMLTPTLKEKKAPNTIRKGFNKHKLSLEGSKRQFNNFGFYDSKQGQMNKQQIIYKKEGEEEEDSPIFKSNLLKKFFLKSSPSANKSNPQEENGVLVNQTMQPFEKNQPLKQQYWVFKYDQIDIKFN